MKKNEAMAVVLDVLRDLGMDKQALYLENHELVEAMLSHEHTAYEYGDAECHACGSYGGYALSGGVWGHDPDCFILHARKQLESPLYDAHEEARRQEREAEALRLQERARREANRCRAEGGCTQENGHEGKHTPPVTLRSLNDMMKSIYGNLDLFGVDREAQTTILRPETIALGHSDMIDALKYASEHTRKNKHACPHCGSTSMTPLTNSQMLTCDVCLRASAYGRTFSPEGR